MKAVASFVCTGVLPPARPPPAAAAATASSVRRLRTTSTSFISGTGLKKCRPSTWPGRRVAGPPAGGVRGGGGGAGGGGGGGGAGGAGVPPERVAFPLRPGLPPGDEPLERAAQPAESARDQLVAGLDEQH